MSFTHALGTNRYGEADLIVSTSASNGTHTTLASAMAAATSGQTIFLRDSVTENVTITPGVNIAAWSGGSLNVPSITGTLTMTGAGTSTLSGLRLVTNSAALIAVTGSAASILNVNNCYLNCSNNTGITFSTSSSSARININNSTLDLGTTGIGYYTHSSAGALTFVACNLTNSGASTTASSNSAGNVYFINSNAVGVFSTSSTGAFNTYNARLDSNANVTTLTHNGTGANSGAQFSSFTGGTASAISIGTGATFNMYNCAAVSSNTNAITGAGTLNNAGVFCPGSSSVFNTSTINGSNLNVGGISFNNGTNVVNSLVTTTAHGTVVFDGTNLINTATGTSGQVLTSNGPGSNPTYQAAPGGGLLTATKNLTSTQIKALHATPIEIVAAPGLGKCIILVSAVARFNYGGTNVFVAGASQTIDLYLGTATQITNNGLLSNALIVSSATGVVPSLSGLKNNNSGVTVANSENLALNAWNATATEISGNAANNNTIDISILYYIASI